MHSRVSTGRFWVVFAFLMALFMLAGCAGGNKQSEIVPADEGILRVGVSTDYPPLIYKENDEIVGAEADLARAFAEYLGRKPVFVEIAWENQIDALKADQTDIIMSGMSVTEERLYQIAFSKAYFRTG